MPDLAGMTEQKARATLGDAGLEVGTIDRTFDNTVKANRVITQDPGPDESVDKGATVDFTLSLGTHPTKVPYVIGQTQDQAASNLSKAHLDAEFKPVASDQPQGTVVSTQPTAGTQVPQGSPVVVQVSKGPQKVPDVVGMQQSDAEDALRARGFVPVPVTSPSDKPQGEVIQQVPGANSPQPQGTTVTIVVSLGPDRVAELAELTHLGGHQSVGRHVVGGALGGAVSSRGRTLAYGRPRRPAYAGAVILVLDLLVPADGDVGVGGVGPVDLQVGVARDRIGERGRVTDRGDHVGLAVGHALELHGVADAADAGRADHPLTLDGDRPGAALPHRVDDGLDVLLVHEQEVGVVAVARAGVGRCVGEGHAHPRADLRQQTRLALHGSRAAVERPHLLVVDRPAEERDLSPEVVDASLEGVDPGGVVPHDRRQVGEPPRPQVGPLAAVGADHEERTAEQAHHGRRDPPHQGPSRTGVLTLRRPLTASRRAQAAEPAVGFVAHAD